MDGNIPALVYGQIKPSIVFPFALHILLPAGRAGRTGFCVGELYGRPPISGDDGEGDRS